MFQRPDHPVVGAMIRTTRTSYLSFIVPSSCTTNIVVPVIVDILTIDNNLDRPVLIVIVHRRQGR
jgi:hypothetical protein